MSKIEKLMQQVQPHLRASEEVLATVLGFYEVDRGKRTTGHTGILLATSQRVIVFAKKIGGFDLESFPYANISSFEQSRGILGSKAKLFASGNTLKLTHVQNHAALAQVVGIVSTRIGRQIAPPPAAVPAQLHQHRADPIEQLRRLGELRDTGVVTQQEFEAKKAELLAQL